MKLNPVKSYKLLIRKINIETLKQKVLSIVIVRFYN